MFATIVSRTLGRSRFLYDGVLRNCDVNKLKYKIERLSGVKSCKISPLANSIIVNYEEKHLPKIAKFILELNLEDLKNFEIDDVDFVPQEDRELFHILRDAMYRRIFFAHILPMPLRPIGILIRAIPYIKAGLRSLKNRKLDVAILDATAIGISILDGEFNDAGNIMFLLGLGEELEDYTLKKSKEDLAQSLKLNIEKVFVVDGDKKYLKKLEEVNISEVVEVNMGSTIPVDGEIIKGLGMVNESSLTGESLAVKKTEGKTVFAGTVLEEGAILVKTTKKHDESRINHIIELIGESEKNKSLAEKRAESIADSIVKYSFLGAGITYLLTRNFIKAKSFLMVDFSCALKLTIPIATMKAISSASGREILVKGGRYLEKLAQADSIIFDKTGTLTKSEPKVEKVIAFYDNDKDECLRIAACLEEHFPHSIANAVVKAAKEKNLNHEEMHSKPEYIVAHGIKSKIGDKEALIGSAHFILEDEKIKIDEEQRNKIDELKEDYSLLYLAFDEKLIAVICIDDPIREDAKYTIDSLRKLGFTRIAMLTGDAENSARAVAEKLDLDYYKAQVLPEDKKNYVDSEKERGRTVVMIGDGINDSIALSSADVGISMHEGADIAKEIADISIKSDSLKELIDVIKIARELEKRVHRSYRHIVSFNGALIALGVAGHLTNTNSAFLHNASTVAIAGRNMMEYRV
ncbi:heavy metal translocating P-type ATPase [Peptoniphilus sp. AGMB00490]|uniref:Cd(2+)-exporting ATPase n=1 Tax=Peptoniphilus faecalis TaxID=2731255 RepID=A0A848R6N6_9FIRM|nr:heavy metal translocating P-type ATPase [Peptoniphilus faecalis]NMW84947.1 heavy metal translocating P-type ATPase [Peptoniphilus faecalis]